MQKCAISQVKNERWETPASGKELTTKAEDRGQQMKKTLLTHSAQADQPKKKRSTVVSFEFFANLPLAKIENIQQIIEPNPTLPCGHSPFAKQGCDHNQIDLQVRSQYHGNGGMRVAISMGKTSSMDREDNSLGFGITDFWT